MVTVNGIKKEESGENSRPNETTSESRDRIELPIVVYFTDARHDLKGIFEPIVPTTTVKVAKWRLKDRVSCFSVSDHQQFIIEHLKVIFPLKFSYDTV